MKGGRFLRRLPWIAIAALVLLLGWLQHRWLGEVVRSERQRLSIVLHTTSAHAATDFDRELSRIFLHFQPPQGELSVAELETHYAAAATAWRSQAGYPDLLAGLSWLRRDAEGVWHRRFLDRETERFQDGRFPPPLAAVREQLADPVRSGSEPGSLRLHFPHLPELPGLVLPLAQLRRAESGESRGETEHLGDHLAELLASVMVIELDLAAIERHLLPDLLGRYGLGEDSDYFVEVAVRDSGLRVYPPSEETPPTTDFAARTPLFALRPLAELRAMWLEQRSRPLTREESAALNLAAVVLAIGGDRGGWELRVAHREGSLAVVVQRNQVRHLWVVGGVLAVLGLALATLQLSQRRAQELARQQVEFVAGISHELRTPLASIKSLAHNLSQGLVSEPSQVKRYGTVLARDEARLSGMVEQVLAFSGRLAGRDVLQLEETDLGELARRAAEAHRREIEDVGKELVVQTADTRLLVRADGEALERALGNLLANAVKYGGDGRRITVEVRRDPAAGEARVTVRDEGPGVSRDDLPHVFEPFYRSAEARASQMPGSGLGLSFVRQVAAAHGGRTEVSSSRGQGAAFSITLPLEGEAS